MIPLIFAILIVAWYLYQHMENRRKDRREEQHERRISSYEKLLQLLKDKEEKDNTKEQSNH